MGIRQDKGLKLKVNTICKLLSRISRRIGAMPSNAYQVIWKVIINGMEQTDHDG